MLAFWTYGFLWRALIAGVMMGILAPLIGVFLVSKRYSLMADSLAHVALAGVAIGMVMGWQPLAWAVGMAVVMAVGVEWLRAKKKVAGEMALAVLMAGGLAGAVVIMGLGGGFGMDLNSYLFGNLLTVTWGEIAVMGSLGVVVLGLVGLNYRQLKAVAFDEEMAAVAGIRTWWLNLGLMVVTAVTVTLAMRVVGVLLIGALMVIPVVTALQLRRSFNQTVGWSVGWGVVAVGLGLAAAYEGNLASGGAIVLVAVGMLGVVLAVTRWWRR